jgi:tripartite-type tricarboxylate transporter receptor subunit TctC
MRLGFVILAIFLSTLTGPSKAIAQGDLNSPRFPKEVRLLVGSEAGGGYDVYARLVAPFLEKYLPGNPTLVVQNMAGAGGLKLANYMAQIAPPDGGTIAITNRNLIAAPLLRLIDPANADYDPAKLTWLANLNTDVSFVIIRAATGVRTVDDLKTRDVLVGSANPTENNGIFPYVLNNLLGARFKVISGYPSSNELALAMDRSEIDGVVGFSWSSLVSQRPNWLKDHYINLIMQLGLTPLPQEKDVPLALNLVSSPVNRKALELLATLNTIGRPFFGPPTMAPAVQKTLRDAFAHAVTDPAFIATAQRARLDYAFTDGATLQGLVEKVNSYSPEVAEAARRALRKTGPEGKAHLER